LSQEQIREQILERFGMVTASRKDGFLTWNPLTTGVSQLALSVEEQQPYRAIVDSINYVVCGTWGLKRPTAKGCTDDGTLVILPIEIPILDWYPGVLYRYMHRSYRGH
jgi:hypothetical protein